jgi:hypothetical protein
MNIKFKKVAAVFASTVMLSSTIALAAAASYPAPFVSGSNADVALVWGGSDTALQSDFAAVTDISTSLSGALTTTSSGPSTVSGGDFVQLEKSSNKINLGDDVAAVFGVTIDSDDLSVVLADGTYLNDENTEYDYEQKLTLGSNLDVTFFADSDYMDKEPTVGIHLGSSTHVLNYTLDFTTDAESDQSSGDLVDLETTDIEILGKNYYILDAKNGTGVFPYAGKLTLLDSANTAIIAEGETETVNAGDESYDVSINFIQSSSVKVEVNGEVTNSLAIGETYKLSDGTYVGVKDILYNSKDTGISKVELSIGNGKLELDSGQDIELNDDEVDGLKSYVYVGASGAKTTIDKIVIEWTTNDEEFITPDQDLLMPGFEAVKLSMGSFVTSEDPDEVMVDYDGDDSIQLTVPIKDGEASFNILQANSTGGLILIGKDSDERLATTNGTTLAYFEKMASDNFHSYFVATYATTSDAESYLLSATVSETNGKNRTTITNEVTNDVICKDKAAGDDCDFGDVSLSITEVNKSSTDESVVFTAGSNVVFDQVYTAGGMKIQLPYNVSVENNATTDEGAIHFADLADSTAGHSPNSFILFFDTEDKDDDKNQGPGFNLTINNDADGDLHVTDIDVSSTELDVKGTSDDTVSMTTGEVSTTVTRVVSSDKGKAVISYPGEENYAEIFITEAGTSVGSGDGEVSIMTVTDAEASTVSDKNLVVVGGSCVNTVAADLLGVAASTCGEAWETATGVNSGEFLIQTFAQSGGKVATLVAGYNAGDTTNAAKYLTTADDVEIAESKKYVGTTATEAVLVA